MVIRDSVPVTERPPLLAQLFRGLADTARLRCLLAVRDGPLPVGQIVAATGLSQSNVSQHLACLRDCGLVRAERDGRFVRYSLTNPDVERLLLAAEALLIEVGEEIAVCPRYRDRQQP